MCLRTQLERATSIERVEELHAQLRRLDPDLDAIAPTLLELFYRFLHHYPREPLHGWLRDFHEAAKRIEAVRAQIPYLARVSGASWLLEGAEAPARKEALLPAFLEAVRSNAFGAPQNLLRQAYETRTLRRSDLIAIFSRIVSWPGQEAVLQSAFEIMSEAKLATPEIVDRCLDALGDQPHGAAAFEIQKFLVQAGKSDVAHRQRILERFTQSGYTQYGRRNPSPRDAAAPPRTWHDWQWQGSRLMHRDWPIASLFLELASRGEMRRVLAQPLDDAVLAVATIQYVVLDHWWQQGGAQDADDYRALGELMRHASAPRLRPLLERALAVFARRWNEFAERDQRARGIPGDLAILAADAYSELCLLHPQLRKTEDPPWPPALLGLDRARLAERWRLEPGLLDQVADECRLASVAEEAEAERLWQEYVQAVNDGRQLDGPRTPGHAAGPAALHVARARAPEGPRHQTRPARCHAQAHDASRREGGAPARHPRRVRPRAGRGARPARRAARHLRAHRVRDERAALPHDVA
jgi:hypothetical protein